MNNNAQQPASKPSVGMVIVFCLVSLVFLSGGSYMAYRDVMQPLSVLNKARAWVETPATILQIEKYTKGGKSGGSVYMAVRYQYEFNGQPHTSERFTPFTSRNSEYHIQNHHVYKRLHDADEPITCWVNPFNPAEAVVDRNPIFINISLMNALVYLVTIGGLFFFLCAVLYFTNPEQLANGPMPSYFFTIPAVLTFVYSFFLLIKLLPFLPWPWHTCLIFLPAVPSAIFCFHRYNCWKNNSKAGKTKTARFSPNQTHP